MALIDDLNTLKEARAITNDIEILGKIIKKEYDHISELLGKMTNYDAAHPDAPALLRAELVEIYQIINTAKTTLETHAEFVLYDWDA